VVTSSDADLQAPPESASIGQLFRSYRPRRRCRRPQPRRQTRLSTPSRSPAQVSSVTFYSLGPRASVDGEDLPLPFDRNDRVLSHPIRPTLFDDLAGVERHGQPNAEELRRIRGTWRHTPSNLIGSTGARGFVEAAAPLYNGALTRMKRAGGGVGRE
jgi:hypothetical protein